jgi:hypothetical protein
MAKKGRIFRMTETTTTEENEFAASGIEGTKEETTVEPKVIDPEPGEEQAVRRSRKKAPVADQPEEKTVITGEDVLAILRDKGVRI